MSFAPFVMKLGESSELRVAPAKLYTGGVGLSLRKFVKTASGAAQEAPKPAPKPAKAARKITAAKSEEVPF